MSEQPDKERFDELLVGFVCDRLEARERLWMEQFLLNHPELAVEVEIERNLREVLREAMPKSPADQGLDRFMRRIEEDSKESPPLTPPGWARTFWDNFKHSLAVPMMKPAWATMGIMVLAQTGIIGFLLAARSGQGDVTRAETEFAQWRSVGEAATFARGPVLQITFKPTATEAEIRLLLVKIRGTIVAGPGQLGHYIVKVPEDRVEATAQELQGNEILESVEILPEIPKEE
ncbi:MAG: hypothetical protein H6R26_3489 [Proteobacteria bacterium]|nr:hypothetical protein [Pseudomonadota bacterium]